MSKVNFAEVRGVLVRLARSQPGCRVRLTYSRSGDKEVGVLTMEKHVRGSLPMLDGGLLLSRMHLCCRIELMQSNHRYKVVWPADPLTLTDSRGWTWTQAWHGPHSLDSRYTESWQLTTVRTNQFEAPGYGAGVHVWVKQQEGGRHDGRWYCGSGGSAIRGKFHPTHIAAIEASAIYARRYAEQRLAEATREVEVRLSTARAVGLTPGGSARG